MLVIEKFSAVRILCVCDVMVDDFIEGSVSRISPEGPVPVLLAATKRSVPGGAANVARNIAALGGSCTIIGVVGDDEAGRGLEQVLLQQPNITAAFAFSRVRPTTKKIRYLSAGRQLLRVDYEMTSPVENEIETAVIDKILAEMPRHDVLVLSDYAKGVLTDKVISIAVEMARRHGKPIIVDPKSRDMSRYAGATIVTPNARELELASGMIARTEDEVISAATSLLDYAKVDCLYVTRAEKGMIFVGRDCPPLVIPSKAVEVFDVAGAGDTVVATLALAIGSGAEFSNAGYVANAAAGIVVGRRGTATLSQSELLAELNGAPEGGAPSVPRIVNEQQLVQRVKTWRGDGLRVGFTNGCFDILHPGHIRLLRFARAHCDRLIVAVNRDESVRRLKGAGRPLNAELDRAEVIASLDMVDAVTLFGEDTPLSLIETIQPDVLVKGADYALEEIVGADCVKAAGGEVLRCPLVPGRSATSIIEKARAKKSPA